MKYLLISLILLSGCGTAPKIDSQLQPFVDSFLKYAEQHNLESYDIDFNILFVPTMSGTTVGTCGFDGIKINKAFWDNVGHYDHEQLMFHELGHCVLGHDHIAYPSIMYPYMLNLSYYLDHRIDLFKTLFTLPQQKIYVTPGSSTKIDCEFHEVYPTN